MAVAGVATQGAEAEMKRTVRIAGICVIVAGVLSGAGVAAAAPGGTGHTVTTTEISHITQPLSGTNPCAPLNPVSGHTDDNIVTHVTFFPESGEVRFTFTDQQSLIATDLTTGVVTTGHATVTNNFNLTQRNATSTLNVTIRGTGSDGSTVYLHETAHFTLNANGVVTVDFDKVTLTCG
ncbi:MAG: hypothetical protein ABJA81_02485 [Nocardioidaceae bacterium]